MNRTNYHHGDLRAVILTEAARLVAERGPDGVSLRELARSAGVSHAAPAHHFTDRRGLFTALATQGFLLLAEALIDARGDFADAALAYVRFASVYRRFKDIASFEKELSNVRQGKHIPTPVK